MRELWCDLETFSPIPIKHGTAKYAEEAEALLFSWAIDDADAQVWDIACGELCPPDLEQALLDPEALVWFQNGTKFDWTVMPHVLPWVDAAVPLERRRDTMVQAYSHSLPGSLAMMCAALGVAENENKIDGKRFIRLFCVPPPKNVKDRSRRTAETHPAEWAEFKVYAAQDITAMRAAHRKMPMWNYKGKQLVLEQLDARINARGIFVDQELAEAAVRASDIAKTGLNARTRELTDGAVQTAGQVDAMLAHILALYGVELPDMQKDTIERRALDENLPEELRELLRVRLGTATTSVAKYSTLLRGVNSDGYLRGTQQFRGAARTGRVGHRMFQPGNMPRPDMEATEIAWAIELLKLDAAHLVFESVMKVCSNAIRGTIIAPPGKKLVVADLANIEGRFAAWLAGEDWKLQAFRDYDAGIGPDLYVLAYAKSFNVDPGTVGKGPKRQIGKVQELMFQYGGGVGAWITGAATYGIDLDDMTEQVFDTLPAWAIEEAERFLRWLYEGPIESHRKAIEKGTDPAVADALLESRKAKARHMLPERTFVACDAIKRLWRTAHPRITSYWPELENVIEACILDPGVTRTARRLKVRCDGAWLRIALPSGRALCYPGIALNAKVTLPSGATKSFPGISYMGIDQYTKKWQRIGTYGGKIFENVTQAGSCDQLLECGPAIDEHGFEIVLSVHDEYVTYAPVERDDLTADLLGEMMCADLGWNEGLPLAAAGYEAQRYKKE